MNQEHIIQTGEQGKQGSLYNFACIQANFCQRYQTRRNTLPGKVLFSVEDKAVAYIIAQLLRGDPVYRVYDIRKY